METVTVEVIARQGFKPHPATVSQPDVRTGMFVRIPGLYLNFSHVSSIASGKIEPKKYKQINHHPVAYLTQISSTRARQVTQPSATPTAAPLAFLRKADPSFFPTRFPPGFRRQLPVANAHLHQHAHSSVFKYLLLIDLYRLFNIWLFSQLISNPDWFTLLMPTRNIKRELSMALKPAVLSYIRKHGLFGYTAAGEKIRGWLRRGLHILLLGLFVSCQYYVIQYLLMK